MDYVAVDFETANEQRSSPCAFAAVVVKDGHIVESRSWLIRPPELYFNPYNTAIHGISEHDVEHQPGLCDLWNDLRGFFENRLVIAHNASFDVSVLRSTLQEYGIPVPEFRYLCTRMLSRAVWPGLPSYSLPAVADLLGYSFHHHDAMEDAKACSEIAVGACKARSARSLDELAQCLEIQVGCVRDGECTPSQSRARRQWRSAVRVGDIVPSATEFDPGHPLFGARVAFTGTLQSMTRREAMQKVVDVGAQCATSVSKKTEHLIVGDFDYSQFRAGTKSAKLRAAEDLVADGHAVEIIPEADFIRLLCG